MPSRGMILPSPGDSILLPSRRTHDSRSPIIRMLQALAIEQAHCSGARGLTILKTLGLYLRENITSGTLVEIDDPRFDPMWDTCGELHIPVAIHVSDPVAFFMPTDRFNERYEELNNHPDWSFYGGDFPSNTELLEARNCVIAQRPQTQFGARGQLFRKS